MNKNLKIGILVLILLVALLFIVNLNNTGFLSLKNIEQKEYTVGVIMPLSGDASAFGIPFQKTVNLAVNEINKEGGINGNELKVIFEDGKCSNKDAVNSANKLINIDRVNVIIGGICSGETLGAAPIAEENKVILFSPASGSPKITYAGDYVFRNMASDAYSGKKIAQAAIENNHKKIAIITENTEYPISLSNVFRKEFENLGGKIVIEEKFDTQQKDFKTIIDKVISKNPDAIYLNPQTPKTFTILLKQLSQRNYSKQLYGNEYTRSKEVLDDYSKEIDGIIFAEANFDENREETKSLLNKLEENNIDLSFPSYQTKVYDSVYIIKDAIENCGTDQDTGCIKDYLYSIENREGIDGSLTINKYGDAELEFVLKQVKNGEVVVYNN